MLPVTGNIGEGHAMKNMENVAVEGLQSSAAMLLADVSASMY
jgi:hypothetical protein